MKDRQALQTPALLRIPVLSTVLHLVSMSVLVFMRFGFGYAYLRPKSLFFAGSWAFLLFTVYAWYEPKVWAAHSSLCMFGVAAVVLYALHFTWAFASELRGTATHDNHAGTPHTLRIFQWLDLPVSAGSQNFWVIWAEPGFVLLAGLLCLGGGHAQRSLSTWLLLTGPCLWLKEALSYWLQLRQRKKQRDSFEDAEEGLKPDQIQPQADLPAPTRKDKVQRQRSR